MARRLVLGLVVLLVVLGVLFYLYPLWFLDQKTEVQLWRNGVHGHFVTVNGNRIHYLEAGSASGVPLVLIHGLGASAEEWTNLIPEFAAQGFHVYAPDLLGYGRSSRPGDADYSIAQEEETVRQFMMALHVPKAHVIGWSMGGWVAMRFALDHPDMVEKLAVYDAAGTYFPAVLPPDLFTPQNVAEVQRLIDVLEPEPRRLPGFIARDTLKKLQGNSMVVNRSLGSMLSGRYLLDFRLPELKMPMLIVWGGSDHLIPPSVGEGIHRLVPQSEFHVVPGCGHLGPAECSGAYLEHTVPFLKK